MGYTHYWNREKLIDEDKFHAIVDDFKKLVPVFATQDVVLAGGLGAGEPQVNYEDIWFNGPENCGHPENHAIGIAWPAEKAGGVGSLSESLDGAWFAGRKLEKRCCGGDCSHETLHFPQILKTEDWQKPEMTKGVPLYFEFCKTAFKPYDWAVTAFLIIAKHHLGDKLVVHSDGETEHWQDARLVCQLELGYGLEFKLDEKN